MSDERHDWIEATDDTLGGRISLARDACELSIEDAAEMTGVDADAWLAWENDRDEPLATQIEAIAGCLKVSLYWLLSGRGSGPEWSKRSECEEARQGAAPHLHLIVTGPKP